MACGFKFPQDTLQLTLMKKLKASGHLDVDTYSKIYQTVILVVMQVCPSYVICFGCLLRLETLWTSQSTKLFNNINNFCVHGCVLCAFETSSITFRDEQQHKKDMPILGVRFICGSTVWCGLFNFLYEFLRMDRNFSIKTVKDHCLESNRANCESTQALR